jgi:recombination protein RecT
MSKNQLSTLPLTPQITEAFAPQVLEVIRTSIAPTANDQEFLLFAHKAASYGLDPFKNEIFFIKYGNQARIQFAAEAYLSKAREKEGFIPPDTQMVHENDEFEIDKNPETKELEVVKHKIGFPRGKIIGAYSIAYREGYRPVTVISDIDEIAHMFTGQNKDNWNKWTADMFGKHVQQRALKKQYGLEFEDETINQVEGENSIPEYKPQARRDITPNQRCN